MLLGCQTITFRNADPAWPLPATLEAVAAAGFDGVELAAGSIDLTAPDRVEALVRQHGLEIAALHLPSANFEPAAKPRAPIDLGALRACLERCGVPFLLTSGTGQQPPEDLARLLAAAGRDLASVGVKLCYHNHGVELADEGRWLADFCAASDPADVGLAFDLGWATRAGADPVAMVRRFAPRIRYVHVKDTAGDLWTELGRGQVDLPAVLAAVQELDLPWWVAEQDRCGGDPAESVRVNASYLRAWREKAGAGQ